MLSGQARSRPGVVIFNQIALLRNFFFISVGSFHDMLYTTYVIIVLRREPFQIDWCLLLLLLQRNTYYLTGERSKKLGDDHTDDDDDDDDGDDRITCSFHASH